MSDKHPFPTEEQVETWERVARGKLQILQVISETIASGEPASSGYLSKRCGLSAEEWHGNGELIAALIYFGYEKGFLEWHAKDMVR